MAFAARPVRSGVSSTAPRRIASTGGSIAISNCLCLFSALNNRRVAGLRLADSDIPRAFGPRLRASEVRRNFLDLDRRIMIVVGRSVLLNCIIQDCFRHGSPIWTGPLNIFTGKCKSPSDRAELDLLAGSDAILQISPMIPINVAQGTGREPFQQSSAGAG